MRIGLLQPNRLDDAHTEGWANAEFKIEDHVADEIVPYEIAAEFAALYAANR